MAQNIVITGAGSGIGRACAQAFLGAGWQVALVGRREETLRNTANGDPGALVVPFDVSQPAEVEAGFAQIANAWGRIDVLFNNAGIFTPGAPIDEIPVADWTALCGVNITGMFLCARAAFGQMRRQAPQGGRIINNGSISAHVPRPGSAPYTMSKHAVSGLTRSVSLDGRPFGIACGQIDVGNALTEMAAPMAKGVKQADGSIAPEAVMDVAHVASTVLHMASLPPEANVQFVTVMATTMPFVGRG
ncbi:SDR family oxidoreductase [Salipiger sp. 1_MG-2023]|uniref:SDR family oxidoreductase n=1 Tax=Salipiger sp. 1_MG-2023 TaxID=3062665 RepID=UPI0026E2905A|nr:SDR family oxidoreductase [Salipiger sp. 1_MG-2023]MDO6586512.1 SDR family oxidoreductase [Salipiger sp. 1_MG-2023]